LLEISLASLTADDLEMMLLILLSECSWERFAGFCPVFTAILLKLPLEMCLTLMDPPLRTLTSLHLETDSPTSTPQILDLLTSLAPPLLAKALSVLLFLCGISLPHLIESIDIYFKINIDRFDKMWEGNSTQEK